MSYKGKSKSRNHSGRPLQVGLCFEISRKVCFVHTKAVFSRSEIFNNVSLSQCEIKALFSQTGRMKISLIAYILESKQVTCLLS